jgi:hypothetical protein
MRRRYSFLRSDFRTVLVEAWSIPEVWHLSKRTRKVSFQPIKSVIIETGFFSLMK